EPGASAPAITLEIADGSRITGRSITIPSLRIGKFTEKNVEAVVLGPEARNATPLRGMSFLGRFEFKLDSNRRQLILNGIDEPDASSRPRH
ncbi:MAG TPA: hypothetical protein VML55_07440, partial [Planctomycetaceae bacterium]|nr:hypothetical protein [Planctomycetaceae bacterium]